MPVHGGGATGRPAATPPRRLIALMLVLAVSGCGGYSQTNSIGGLLPPAAPGAVPEDAKPVDPGTAQTLEHGTAGERLQYRSADGRQVSVVLGPIYSSARGVPCRLGRTSRVDAGGASPTSYPFCRLDTGWYEVTPVVISGY